MTAAADLDPEATLAQINSLGPEAGQLAAQAAAGGVQLFYDSASYEFPAGATHVVAYASGDFAYSKVKPDGPPIQSLYPFVHWITVLGRPGGWQSQILDYEQYNEAYERTGAAREWAEARLTREMRAIFYADRANLHRLRDEVGPLIWASPKVEFWIPTLDGRFWAPAALSWDIAHAWGVYIPAGRIWANQGRDSQQSGGPWDTSALYGSW